MTLTKFPRARLALVLTAAATLAACSAVPLPPASPHAETVQQLRGAALAPAQIGTFKLAAGKPAAMDTELGGLRAASVKPSAGTFSGQLRSQLATELGAAGLLKSDSPVVIDGVLTDSQVDAAIGTGTGRLAARFSVKRNGQVVYDKELVAEDSWESSFVGAVAIPRAIEHYGALYQALVKKLVDDAEFRSALKA